MALGLSGWLESPARPSFSRTARSLATLDTLDRFVGREAVATLREVVLMPRDLAPVVPEALPGEDVVVLVHGFFASAGVFRPLRARLERDANARVATFSHAPGAGVGRIAKQLGELVARIPLGTRIHIVGHSLGGLVARWFVQELEGHARVVQTISLATPFGGTHVARHLPVLIGAELRASSRVLARLRARAHIGDVPHVSIVAGDDKLIVGKENAVFARGETIVLPGRGHNSLLFDDEVARLVIERVARHQITRPRFRFAESLVG